MSRTGGQRITAQLETLLPAERTRLVRLCARLSEDYAAAEDLAQETLLTAWRLRHRLVTPQGYDSWLTAIARNICLRWRRRYFRERSRQVSAEPGEALAPLILPHLPSSSLDTEMDREELAGLLDRAMAVLPPQTRRVLVERYVEQMPQAEIAARLGLTEGAVEAKLHRGKQSLRHLLTHDMREEATAYGLLSDPSRALVETQIWCPVCGRRRLVSRVPTEEEQRFGIMLDLRCPDCQVVDVPYRMQATQEILGEAKGHKMRLRRMQRWMNDYYRPPASSLNAACWRCGQPVPREQTLPSEVRTRSMHSRGIQVCCRRCGYTSYSTVDTLVICLPEMQTFWQQQSRIRFVTEKEISMEGQPAVCITYESMTTQAKMDILCDPKTLQTRRIEPYL